MDLSGFGFGPRPAQGVHDELCARALVLAGAGAKVAVLACDLLGIDADFARLIKQEIARRTDIAAADIMICASHTHSGPAVHFLRGCGTPEPAYLRELGRNLVEVVRQAARALRPALVGSGRAEHNLAFNRREIAARTNRMDNPEGTVDREVALLRVDDADGRPIVLLYNYAAHPVTQMGSQNRHVSADFPGAASRLIESQFGGVALFLQGCCGNLNPKIWGDFAVTEQAGAALGRKALEAAATIRCADASCLAMKSVELSLALDGPPPLDQARSELLKAEQEYEAKAKPLHLYYRLEWARDVLRRVEASTRRVEEGDALNVVAAPVQALRVGDAAVVAIPGEQFVEIALRIKAASPARQTLVAAYANSANIGYVPIREAYPQMGYEVYGAHMWYGLFRLAPGAAEAIAGAASSLLKQLF